MYINKAKTIVLKIGSSNLVDSRGKLKEKWLNSFVKDVKKYKKKGKNFVIVSSGAIALGQNSLNVKKKKLKIEMSQALASIGQIYLTNIYRKFQKGWLMVLHHASVAPEMHLRSDSMETVFEKGPMIH